MPAAYSLDPRQRVLACAAEDQLTHGALAARFRVGESTVRGWLRRARLTGSVAPTRHVRHGRAPVITGARADVLRALIAEDNARTLAELADLLAARTDAPRLSRSAVCRPVSGSTCGEQKRSALPAEQTREAVAQARTAWRDAQSALRPADLVFVDETGVGYAVCHRPGATLRPSRGRAPRASAGTLRELAPANNPRRVVVGGPRRLHGGE